MPNCYYGQAQWKDLVEKKKIAADVAMSSFISAGWT